MSSSNPMRIAFLLGSGISIHAEMPKTGEITERILSNDGITRDTGPSYKELLYYNSTWGYPKERKLLVVKFLHILKKEIDDYHKLYRTGHSTNYEDLFYTVVQIHDCISRNYDNPVAQPFIDKILPNIIPPEKLEISKLIGLIPGTPYLIIFLASKYILSTL